MVWIFSVSSATQIREQWSQLHARSLCDPGHSRTSSSPCTCKQLVSQTGKLKTPLQSTKSCFAHQAFYIRTYNILQTYMSMHFCNLFAIKMLVWCRSTRSSLGHVLPGNMSCFVHGIHPSVGPVMLFSTSSNFSQIETFCQLAAALRRPSWRTHMWEEQCPSEQSAWSPCTAGSSLMVALPCRQYTWTNPGGNDNLQSILWKDMFLSGHSRLFRGKKNTTVPVTTVSFQCLWRLLLVDGKLMASDLQPKVHVVVVLIHELLEVHVLLVIPKCVRGYAEHLYIII